jgi:hypothetical protein
MISFANAFELYTVKDFPDLSQETMCCKSGRVSMKSSMACNFQGKGQATPPRAIGCASSTAVDGNRSSILLSVEVRLLVLDRLLPLLLDEEFATRVVEDSDSSLSLGRRSLMSLMVANVLFEQRNLLVECKRDQFLVFKERYLSVCSS